MKNKSLITGLLLVGLIASICMSGCKKNALETNEEGDKTSQTEAAEDIALEDEGQGAIKFRSDDEDASKASDAEENAGAEKANDELAGDNIWTPTISEICQYIVDFDPEGLEIEPDGYTGIMESLWYGDVSVIGYGFMDIDEDGVDELLIGEVSQPGSELPTLLYCAYTMRNGKPVLLFNGWARNRYYLLEDGSIYNEGSSGAASSMLGVYKLEKGADSLTCLDCYFTDPDMDNPEVINVYHNTTGDWDYAASEIMDMPYEEVYAMEDKYVGQGIFVYLQPVVDYYDLEASLKEAARKCKKPIAINYADNVFGELSDFTTVEIDSEDDYGVGIAITANQNISDFRIIALTVEEMGDYGQISYSYKDLYQQDTIKPEASLRVIMRLPETVPFYGIVYTTEDGTTYYDSINMSGYDGSVYLENFETM